MYVTLKTNPIQFLSVLSEQLRIQANIIIIVKAHRVPVTTNIHDIFRNTISWRNKRKCITQNKKKFNVKNVKKINM